MLLVVMTTRQALREQATPARALLDDLDVSQEDVFEMARSWPEPTSTRARTICMMVGGVDALAGHLGEYVSLADPWTRPAMVEETASALRENDPNLGAEEILGYADVDVEEETERALAEAQEKVQAAVTAWAKSRLRRVAQAPRTPRRGHDSRERQGARPRPRARRRSRSGARAGPTGRSGEEPHPLAAAKAASIDVEHVTPAESLQQPFPAEAAPALSAGLLHPPGPVQRHPLIPGDRRLT